mmetsp:Transcript_56993/g.121091  ORF Transcript_56993/g.121091 Transcript_56993/m.121091 type:complete len:528 (-) Transcript_56993:518-2101(-)|eukprot:CAMPEP_0206485772 /NCGR_PEP_ID=MMETSP0324_2-20121206/40691_1 /ASSEMBLY_ACC=CAM_ASM_000836 /TAXON_ID=2866 /ORGANISM="Crypthecodinium cohnii, Strain Seligo" /LENGTH=527 /DNA_ID=CAMNT_0053964019 /DNA_START=72 /DNA_END=1655 /DNA_ORIENTATION=-
MGKHKVLLGCWLALLMAGTGLSSSSSSSSAPQSPSAEPLSEWLAGLGAELDARIEIRDVQGEGRGILAVEHIPAGESVVSLPTDAVLLSHETKLWLKKACPKVSSWFRQQMKEAPQQTEDVHALLSTILYVLEDIRTGFSSFHPYIFDMDEHWTDEARGRHPLQWKPAAIDILKGSSAHQYLISSIRAVESDHQWLSETCPKVMSHHGLTSYTRVWSLINTRLLGFNGNPEAKTKEGRAPQKALIPIFDLANHHLEMPKHRLRSHAELTSHYQTALGRFGLRPSAQHEAETLQLWAIQGLEPGQEISDVYGLKPNDEMAWEWGFTVDWTHNMTCLSRAHLRILLDDLSTEPPRSWHRLQLLNPFGQLGFWIDGCFGLQFDQLLSFARFWYLPETEDELAEECGFVGMADRNAGTPPGNWQLNENCKYLSKSIENAALKGAKHWLEKRLGEISGGSADEDTRELKKMCTSTNPCVYSEQWARRDALVIRRDEKVVLEQAISKVQEMSGGKKSRRRRRKGQKSSNIDEL